MTQHWTAANVPDLTGKTAVVTGGNAGLGFEAARVLAARGAQVIIACRDAARGAQAATVLRRDYPRSLLEVLPLDLADLKSIHHFAETYIRSFSRLDILLNNAGLMRIPYRKTTDGFEMQFGVNHLGHFALTGLLLPVLLQTECARVVTVSSSRHRSGHINFDDLNMENSYSAARAYSQSKLANLLFAFELQRRLVELDSNTISVAAHPGYSATNLALVAPMMEKSRLRKWLYQLGNRYLAQPAEQGALPLLFASTDPGVQGAEFFGPDGWKEMTGFPQRVTAIPEAYDPQIADRLWAVSEALTGVKYR